MNSTESQPATELNAVEQHYFRLLIVLTLCDADCAFGLQALKQLQIMLVRAGAFVSLQLEGSEENDCKDLGDDECHIYAPAAYALEFVKFSVLEKENIFAPIPSDGLIRLHF